MNIWIQILIGLAIGIPCAAIISNGIYKHILHKHYAGTLHIKHDEYDGETYTFLQFIEPVEKIQEKRYILLDITDSNFEVNDSKSQ